MNDFVGDIL